nr:tetraspanin-11-like [Paramormyrops kingsleyae]
MFRNNLISDLQHGMLEVLITAKIPLFKCCGSNSFADWKESTWILSSQSEDRIVPDSCCKTITNHCGQRDHPSNIYKVEGGFITKLETFILPG